MSKPLHLLIVAVVLIPSASQGQARTAPRSPETIGEKLSQDIASCVAYHDVMFSVAPGLPEQVRTEHAQRRDSLTRAALARLDRTYFLAQLEFHTWFTMEVAHSKGDATHDPGTVILDKTSRPVCNILFLDLAARFTRPPKP